MAGGSSYLEYLEDVVGDEDYEDKGSLILKELVEKLKELEEKLKDKSEKLLEIFIKLKYLSQKYKESPNKVEEFKREQEARLLDIQTIIENIKHFSGSKSECKKYEDEWREEYSKSCDYDPEVDRINYLDVLYEYLSRESLLRYYSTKIALLNARLNYRKELENPSCTKKHKFALLIRIKLCKNELDSANKIREYHRDEYFNSL
jgi:chromosome segregation ATPase